MARIIDTKLIYDAIYKMARHAVCNVDEDTVNLLKVASARETNATAKFAIDVIIENDEIASREDLPACQDTGMAVLFVEIGQEVSLVGEFIDDEINRAVKDAYKDGYFRASVLDPLTRLNTKDNTPAIIHSEIVKGDKVVIHFLAKGFGSENMSKLYMLTPAAGIEGIHKCVLETVKLAGANPCPPIILGIGIGGTMEKSALLAKKSLLRPTGVSNPNKSIAELENNLLKEVNELQIGAQGFGGVNTALQVNIETYPTHIAGLPVAINIQCHAVRHETTVL